ncbi:MAG: leucyl aminopeptidase [Pseudomonadota bacterium]|nr:leucyl aminopeptidase [Pseudomonadota bacterium]
MKIHFADIGAVRNKPDEVMIFLVGADKRLSTAAQAADKRVGGALSRAVKSGRFSAKRGQVANVVAAAGVLLIGTGETKALDFQSLENLGGALIPHLNAAGVKSATLVVEDIKGTKISLPEAAARIGYGALLRSYRFDKYHTKMEDDQKPTLQALTIALSNAKVAQAPFSELEKVAEGVFFTRDLVNEPANVINPETLAEETRKLSKLGVEVEVLGEPEMYKLGLGALLGVGQGSSKESQLVIMRWNGGGKGKAPVAFVGKGVTFDTGGISIKPAAGMEEMKWDMGGAGVVIGLMKALAGRKAKVNVVGVAGLVENMPGGNAQRPGDVVKSYSGQTIEVLNTDAEGRLVLADALWYTEKHFKPKMIIDLATLTGAIIVALGTSRAGLFSNDDRLAEQLFRVGKEIGEEVWRLPLAEVYDKQINSDIADMQNIGKEREAGSITAAQFLQRFIEKGTPWAHLDIAGVAWAKKDSDTVPKGATAWGVRLLNQLVKEYYEGR